MVMSMTLAPPAIIIPEAEWSGMAGVAVRERGIHIGRQYTHVSGISQVQNVFNFDRISQG